MAGAHDMYINQGETFYRSFQWLLRHQDEAGQTTDTPVNLTGFTGRCQIRRAPGNPLTVSLPVTITDAENGRFAIALDAGATAALPSTGKGYDKPDKYVYDIEMCSADEVYRIVNGYVYLSPEVTR